MGRRDFVDKILVHNRTSLELRDGLKGQNEAFELLTRFKHSPRARKS